MAAQVDIWNRALQKLGAARVQSTSDQSVNSRACATCYDVLRQAELRKHPWNFAVQRFQQAASGTPPAFGYTSAFPLPTGCLLVLPPDPGQNFSDRDWIIEGQQLLTNQIGPLNLRCVIDVTDTTKMDALFIEALASRMAFEMCEALTQSNDKQANAKAGYKDAINDAKKQNAIEKVPQIAPVDEWTSARFNGFSSSQGPGWGS